MAQNELTCPPSLASLLSCGRILRIRSKSGNISATLVSALGKDEIQSVRDEMQMSIAALFTWMVTILAGLILLVIWIIEYDPEFQSAAATQCHGL